MSEENPQTCERCGGPGWIIEDREGEEVALRCPDCRPAERMSLRRQAAHIPPRYLDEGFSSFRTPHRLQQEALKLAIDYVEEFPANDGLLFVGPCGVGKTHLSVAILEALVEEKGIRGRFVDETDLLRRLQYSYGPGSEETEREVLQPLRDAELLVWDDLGTSRSTEWVRETIRMVINHRYTYDRPTIFSTNRAVEEDAGKHRDESLEERIGSRLYSRILEMCRVVKMEGPDARRTRHQERQPVSTLPRLPKQIGCPNCKSYQVEVTDSREKSSEKGAARDLGCRCGQCNLTFFVRFHPGRGQVEYL